MAEVETTQALSAEDNMSIAEEISSKVAYWETAMEIPLSRFNEYSDFFRQVRPPVTDKREGFSDTVTGETTRATRTLSTMMFRMMTSEDPNFYFTSLNPTVTQEQLQVAESLQQWQQVQLQYRRYLLKACQIMALFGTVPVEEPWVQFTTRGKLRWEGTGFYPRSPVQVAFDHTVPEIDISDWHAPIDFVSPARLRALAASSPDTWDSEAIERAIEENGDANKTPEKVKRRRAKAGYFDGAGPVLQLVTYYGNLKDRETEHGADWVVGVVNDKHVVRLHELDQESGLRPVRFAHYVEHELEPYGYGVGSFGSGLQKDINANRRRLVNLATFALYHMWKMSRMAGVKPGQLRIRPWGAVETDDMEGLQPLRPDLNAFNVGKILEDLLKEEFRANTGATANLQAMVTEATASESSIAQNEAVRNISVQTEIAAEQLVRWHIMVSHENNLQYLDRAFYLQVTGKDKPVLVRPGDLPRDIMPYVRVTTDKDFRPERVRRLIEALQTVTSVRNQLPPEAGVAILPLLEELLHGLRVPIGNVLKPKSAVEQMADKIKAARDLAGQAAEAAPDLAAAAGNGVGGSPTATVATQGPDTLASPV